MEPTANLGWTVYYSDYSQFWPTIVSTVERLKAQEERESTPQLFYIYFLVAKNNFLKKSILFILYFYTSCDLFYFRAACYLGLCWNLVFCWCTRFIDQHLTPTSTFLSVALMKAQEQLYEIQTEVKRKVAAEEKLQLDPYFLV